MDLAAANTKRHIQDMSTENERLWNYRDATGNIIGPFSLMELKRLAYEDRISGKTLVIAQETTQWMTYAEVEKTVSSPTQQGQVILEAKGLQGTLQLLDDRIRIKRQGLLSFISHGFKGDKEIYISQISSIQFKPAGKFTSGFIQFAFLGGGEAKGGLLQAAGDENTVVFEKKVQSSFEQIKAEIDKRIAVSGTMGVSAIQKSPLEELEKLAELRDKGIVSPEEFSAKKKQLLGI